MVLLAATMPTQALHVAKSAWSTRQRMRAGGAATPLRAHSRLASRLGAASPVLPLRQARRVAAGAPTTPRTGTGLSPLKVCAQAQAQATRTSRGVKKVQKFTRLPVWPVVPGVIYIILDILRLNKVAAALEARFGGRVCPMMFTPEETDPFVLCVHHRHAFWSWDPVRPIFRPEGWMGLPFDAHLRLLLAEGFPAHPHRGFETVTYILQGALKHRDSTGVKQEYGEGSVQWMTAGRGMLHEEMWVTDKPNHELYQIWVNLPGQHKMCEPRIQLIGPSDNVEVTEGPSVKGDVPAHRADGVTVRVVSSSYGEASSPIDTYSPVTIFHVSVEPGSTFSYNMPASHMGMIYVRSGEATVVAATSVTLATYATGFLDKNGEELIVKNEGKDELDFLFLGGQPLNEPIAAQGAMVMNTNQEVNAAYTDYQQGQFGVPWDHAVDDYEWLEHVAKYRHLMLRR